MNFIEVLEYLRQSPTNCVTHEEWLTKENKAIGFIGCFDKINIDQIHDIGDIPSRFSDINLMLSNRWLKLQDWHKSKKEHTELHTFEEAITAFKEGKIIYRVNDKKKLQNREYRDGRIFYYVDAFPVDWIIKERDK